MSIIVSVKIHDGIVMAADSAVTFCFPDGRPGQIYEHANKIVNLVKGLPIGVMTCGAGNVGNASIATLLKDLRRELSTSAASQDGAYRLDPNSYTMEDVAKLVHGFFTKTIAECSSTNSFLLRICGYSSGRPLPEIWETSFMNGKCDAPSRIQEAAGIGLRWNGEEEALNRLIIGHGTNLAAALTELKLVNADKAGDTTLEISKRLYENRILHAAPIQDAIDLARFLVDTTKGFTRFATNRVKTVGGPIEIAAITKHEAFKWVQRKHFYDRERNPV